MYEIRTKSIYDPIDKTRDGKRILITRHHPRGVKKDRYDEWIRDLAPSALLLKQYKTGLCTWTSFEVGFWVEIARNETVRSICWQLYADLQSHPITLLCYEKEDMPCHRHLIKFMIEHVTEPDICDTVCKYRWSGKK